MRIGKTCKNHLLLPCCVLHAIIYGRKHVVTKRDIHMITPLVVDADRWLPEITRRIVEAARPASAGTQHPDSDVDLLVVLPHLSDTRRAHAIALRQVLADIPVPKDILIASADEFHTKRDVWGTIPYEAAGHGRLLYAA